MPVIRSCLGTRTTMAPGCRNFRCNQRDDHYVVLLTGAVVAPFREEHVMVVAEVVAGIVLLAGVLLALDWFTAGRAKGRILGRTQDSAAENANAAYGAITRDINSAERRSPNT